MTNKQFIHNFIENTLRPNLEACEDADLNIAVATIMGVMFIPMASTEEYEEEHAKKLVYFAINGAKVIHERRPDDHTPTDEENDAIRNAG